MVVQGQPGLAYLGTLLIAPWLAERAALATGNATPHAQQPLSR